MIEENSHDDKSSISSDLSSSEDAFVLKLPAAPEASAKKHEGELLIDQTNSNDNTRVQSKESGELTASNLAHANTPKLCAGRSSALPSDKVNIHRSINVFSQIAEGKRNGPPGAMDSNLTNTTHSKSKDMHSEKTGTARWT